MLAAHFLLIIQQQINLRHRKSVRELQCDAHLWYPRASKISDKKSQNFTGSRFEMKKAYKLMTNWMVTSGPIHTTGKEK